MATTIAFGIFQVDSSGNQPNPKVVPVWVKNISPGFIVLTLDDDYIDADVGFVGQAEPPLLAPGDDFAGDLGLDFSTVPQELGDDNFTIRFQSADPPPNIPPVINLSIECGTGQNQPDDFTTTVSGSVASPNSDLITEVVID